MGTELDEGIRRGLGAAWTRHRHLIRALLAALAVLTALVAAGAAQALTVAPMPTTAGAAGLAGDAHSIASSVAAAARGAASVAASATPPPVRGAAPVQSQIAAAVQSVRTTVSGSVPASPTPGDSPPAHAPTVATEPAPVPTPSPVQQTVTSALDGAGVTVGRGGSETVPVTAIPPASVAGTAGPPLDSQILAAVGDLATRLGANPEALLKPGSGRAGAASAGSAGLLLRTVAGAGRRRPSSGDRSPARRSGRTAAGAAPGPWRPPLLARWISARPSAGPGDPTRLADARTVRRRLEPRRSRSPAPDPATQAPLPIVPAQNGPASAAAGGVGVGAAAAMLFILAAIWLVRFVGDRMPLEAAAWRETLLALRLERPG